MMNIIFMLLKYWKAGAVAILIALVLISTHVASRRGKKLAVAEKTLGDERKTFGAQLKIIEKERQDERERNEFRKKQNRKIALADDGSLFDAYERLRERANARIAR